MVYMVSSWENEKVPVRGFKPQIPQSKLEEDEELEIEKIIKAHRPCQECDD